MQSLAVTKQEDIQFETRISTKSRKINSHELNIYLFYSWMNVNGKVNGCGVIYGITLLKLGKSVVKFASGA